MLGPLGPNVETEPPSRFSQVGLSAGFVAEASNARSILRLPVAQAVKLGEAGSDTRNTANKDHTIIMLMMKGL